MADGHLMQIAWAEGDAHTARIQFGRAGLSRRDVKGANK